MKEIKKPMLDESFYKKINAKRFFYKIYFHGYNANFYYGYIIKDSKFFLKNLRDELWTNYYGLHYGEASKNSLFVPINKFNDLEENKKIRTLDFMKANRNRLLEGFNRNYFIKNQVKYIKLYYFMSLNNLDITDLRLEITPIDDRVENKNISRVYFKDLINAKAHLYGFNSFSIINKVFYEFSDNSKYSNEFFKDFEIVLDSSITEKNVYQSWNMYSNFFQVFLLSLKKHTIHWMIWWDLIKLEDINTENKKITDELFKNYIGKKLIYKPFLIRQLTLIVQTVSALGFEKSYNDMYFDFLNSFKLEVINSKNKKYKKIVSENSNVNNLTSAIFSDNQYNWIQMKHDSWKEKYKKINKHLKDYNLLVKLFKYNPFYNTVFIDQIIKKIEKYRSSLIYNTDVDYKSLIDRSISYIYTKKIDNDFEYTFINNFYLKDFHNISIIILMLLTNEKYDDILLLDQVVKF